ncbi:putative nucleotidyltransferase, Ribonuclease H [Helianthus annuus]|nr:putative nucleotidyltransferase, Ribonuclease H [Helianthus annuus]
MCYDYEIVYKKGAENLVADALSRVQGSEIFQMSLSSLDPILWQRIQQGWQTDPDTKAVIEQLSKGVAVPNRSWNGFMLKRKNKLLIPNDAQLRKDILSLCHASNMGGHSGVKATNMRLKQMFYWKGSSKQVQQFVKECGICQRAKYETIATPGFLQPLPVPLTIFSDISMDFISGLPKVQGKDTIFVIVDRLTKYGHFIALHHPFTAISVAQVFLDNIFKLHGCPTTIVSDRDPVFMSNFWKEFMRLQGIQLALSTAYHPQSDGQTEVLNRCLESYLRSMCMDCPNNWVKWLPLAQWWYNTTFHSAIKMSPHEALYGIKPNIHIPYIPNDTDIEAAEVFHRDREGMIQKLKANLQVARNRMKQQYDNRRTEREFIPGDWVFVKLQPFTQQSLKSHHNRKLAPRFYGPFLVVQRIGQVAYRLDLPPEAQMHPTFHVSLLKKAIGPITKPTPLPTTSRFILQPRAILDRKLVRRGSKAAMKILVHWEGLSIEEASWEFLDEFKLRFPTFVF